MTTPRDIALGGSLCILVPVLERPHRVAPLLASIEAATPEAEVLFLLDPGDEAERRAINDAESGEIWVGIEAPGGNYAAKINHGVRITPRPLIFTGADDLDFRPGWLEAAIAHLTDGIGLVGTNDLCNPRTMAGEHATHFLMTREYAEQPCIDGSPGPLYEGYPHEYVDNELIETARHRGAFAMALDAEVEHLHPMNGKAPMDRLYARSGQRMRQGAKIFRRRQHLWA
jgi:hypothetical protein